MRFRTSVFIMMLLIPAICPQVSVVHLSAAPPKLVIWSIGAPTGEWELIEQYKQATGLSIEYQSLKSTEVMQQLNQGRSADILIGASGAIANLGIDGIMLPLERFISGKGSGMDVIFPNLFMKDPNKKSIYAIPYEVVITNGKMYNRRKFAESGFDADSPPLYWDELYHVSAKMTQWSSGQAIQLGFDSFDWARSFVNFLLEAGGSLFNDTFSKVEFHSGAGMDAVEFTSSLFKLTYPGLDAANARKLWPGFKSPLLDFVEERTVIYDTGLPVSYVLNAVDKQNPDVKDELRFFITRRSSKARPKVTVNVNGIGIFQQTKSMQLAWEFIQWFVSPKTMALATTMRTTLPSRADVYDQQLSRQPEYMASWFEVLQYADPGTVGKVDVPSLLNWPELENTLIQIYTGKAPVDSLRSLGAEWQKKADQAWAKSGVR